MTESMAHGGRAVARHEGQVVFVQGAYPGEEVEVEITRAAAKHSFATATRIVEASPDRIPAPCPHFGPCGGCQWQTASYPAQLRWKQEIVADQLRFVGRLPEVLVRPTLAPGPEYSYRNRMDFRLIEGRPALHRFESHELVPISVCLLLTPPVRALFDSLEVRPEAERVTLRAGVNTGESIVLFDEERGRFHEVVGGVRFRITSRAFFQTNTDGAEALVALVGEAIQPSSDDVLIDGYAGGGLFSATVGALCRKVLAVESDPVALGDLNANARVNVIGKPFERSRPLLPKSWDLAVVDPPRAGLGRAGVNTLVAGRPRSIAYVSCDPATFSRDAAWLVSAGYELVWVQPVDLFPQTYHIELVGAFRSTVAG
ncbi:MAG TPA: class I SAM-dependent RNA methyltransferase [Acidimicrobiia bacterium]|nr:class I SAM-dependent RNA methyltransferase [Acidimicrobiia bacterium]